MFATDSYRAYRKSKPIRSPSVKIENIAITAHGAKVLERVRGGTMEMEQQIDPMKAREVGLRVLRSPIGEKQTTITQPGLPLLTSA